MIFRDKISELQKQGYAALRIADFWQRKIAKDGEDNAEQFYRHLGLNHIEKKGYEWEGLTLSREPKEHEKIAVKGIAGAQESAFESINKILLALRADLISDGLKGIKKLSPANYHELTLQASPEIRSDLKDRLIKVHRQGRQLVIAELNGQAKSILDKICPFEFKQDDDDEFEGLDLLTDVTGSRVVNDVQSRVIAAATRFSLLGLNTGDDLILAVQNEVTNGSTGYIDRASRGLANRVISIGRGDEAQVRSDEWDRVEYSALLDANVCGPCAEEDGKTAANEDDLQPTPNPECLGGDWCRCFHLFINQ